MLRKLYCGACRVNLSRRLLSSSNEGGNGGNDGKPKGPTTKEILGEDILKAINDVADDIHPKDAEGQKTTKSTLISRLVANERASFDVAAASASNEMLDDKALLGLLADVAGSGQKEKAPPRAAQARQERRALVLLRKDIFYEAVQSGYKSDEARQMAEKVVAEAQTRLSEQRKSQAEGAREATAQEETAEQQRDVREQKLYELALQSLEKIYTDDVSLGSRRTTIGVDPKAPRLFSGEHTLGIWKTLEGTNDNSLGFWAEWDRRAALLTNKSFGPTNSFEEQIEWTQRGKQWPYPIDNEYLLGEEENVSFMDHIFLERHLPGLGIPKSGPIAHFMHLVCVGLSKNPYMTAAKKREHLEWFASYFNKEKQKLVHKLHEQEQIAAQNAL